MRNVVNIFTLVGALRKDTEQLRRNNSQNPLQKNGSRDRGACESAAEQTDPCELRERFEEFLVQPCEGDALRGGGSWE